MVDYTIKPCTLCRYSLPVTWTDRDEMTRILRSLGWYIGDEIYCPFCWRALKNGKQRAFLQQLRVRDRDEQPLSTDLPPMR